MNTIKELNNRVDALAQAINKQINGGKGSGNFGHSGRPGLVGGSGDGNGASASGNHIGPNNVWNCRRATVSCGLTNIDQNQMSGAKIQDYYSEYGYLDEATMFESHYPSKEDFAQASRLEGELAKLDYAKRDESEWEGDNSVGMLKAKIKGNCDALLSAMASNYHSLRDLEMGKERADNVADSIRKDISLLREKSVGLNPQRKAIANRVIKVAEGTLKMNGRTGEEIKHYGITETGDVHGFSKGEDGKYRLMK